MAMISTLVVGGGIGGLSLARELTIRGLPVTVLEKAAQLNPIGAGIIMNPNAMRVLERNGLAEALRRDAWPYLMRETCDHRGRLLAVRDYRPLYDSGKLSTGALVHRAHLLEALYRGVPREAVRFGIAVRSIDLMPERVRLETERHGIFEADVLVGADGIHSQVRRHAFGEIEPLYMGYRSHRMVVDNIARVRNFTEFLGRGQRIGLVPVSERRLYVWTTFNSPRERPLVLDSADAFRAMFAQFTDERIRSLFSQLRSSDEIITTEVEEIRLDRWAQGRSVLLGDAVHAMTPNIGQGAGMAMEDAAVLAAELEAVHARGQGLAQGLENYVARRKSRVETVMRVSREAGDEGQLSSVFACWLRNRRVHQAGRDKEKMLTDLERLLAYPG
ncbi:MAG TPA: FAD-dependent monooxygenase [Burkholderiales bacterium]|nr:FAD-dependent monooxygenase [Burkholderiales bacterium]